MPLDLIERIEKWRLSQEPVPPSKVKAIQYLLERGLEASAGERNSFHGKSRRRHHILE